MIKKRFLLIASLLLTLYYSGQQKVSAQQILGNSGGLNIPTAELMTSGTFRGSFNFLGNGTIEGENIIHKDDCWQFDYDTRSYSLAFAPFSWIEVGFRNTTLYSRYRGLAAIDTGEYSYCRADRSYTIKLKPLSESKYLPAVVIGANDPFTDTGHGVFSSFYGVASKNFHSNIIASNLSVTVGYAKKLKNSQNWDGVFAGMKYTNDYLKQVSLLAEYDTRDFNIGIESLLFNHLGIVVFTHGFENINFSINYQYTIKY